MRMASRDKKDANSSGDGRLVTPSGAALKIASGGGRLLVGVRLNPSAPQTAVRGIYGDRLKISVNAPPEDNRANRQLVQALAEWLGLRRDDVSIESGRTGRDKVVAFTGIDELELRNRLAGLVGGDRRAKGQ